MTVGIDHIMTLLPALCMQPLNIFALSSSLLLFRPPRGKIFIYLENVLILVELFKSKYVQRFWARFIKFLRVKVSLPWRWSSWKKKIEKKYTFVFCLFDFSCLSKDYKFFLSTYLQHYILLSKAYSDWIKFFVTWIFLPILRRRKWILLKLKVLSSITKADSVVQIFMLSHVIGQ